MTKQQPIIAAVNGNGDLVLILPENRQQIVRIGSAPYAAQLAGAMNSATAEFFDVEEEVLKPEGQSDD